MMMSDSFKKYWAPPAHSPCTAVTTGFQTRCLNLGASAIPGSKLFQTLERVNQSPPALTSMPVENARSPFAWSRAQWMSSVSRMVSQAQDMSIAMASLKEFRLSGRLSVMVATLSSTSNRIVSRSMLPSLGHDGPQRRNSTLFYLGFGSAVADWRGPPHRHQHRRDHTRQKKRTSLVRQREEKRGTRSGDQGQEGRRCRRRVGHGQGI